MNETEAIIRMTSYFHDLMTLEVIQTLCIGLIAVIVVVIVLFVDRR